VFDPAAYSSRREAYSRWQDPKLNSNPKSLCDVGIEFFVAARRNFSDRSGLKPVSMIQAALKKWVASADRRHGTAKFVYRQVRKGCCQPDAGKL
jgi:hypothetical protein